MEIRGKYSHITIHSCPKDKAPMVKEILATFNKTIEDVTLAEELALYDEMNKFFLYGIDKDELDILRRGEDPDEVKLSRQYAKNPFLNELNFILLQWDRQDIPSFLTS